jgi:hypothetical protein
MLHPSSWYNPEYGSSLFLLNVEINFNELHGVASQRTVIFIATVVRTLNLTKLMPFVLFVHCRLSIIEMGIGYLLYLLLLKMTQMQSFYWYI